MVHRLDISARGTEQLAGNGFVSLATDVSPLMLPKGQRLNHSIKKVRWNQSGDGQILLRTGNGTAVVNFDTFGAVRCEPFRDRS